MTDNTQDLPSYVRPELEAVTPQLNLMADILGGTPAMHAKVTTYIRKWTDEEPAVYAIRSKCEEVYEGLSRVLSAAVGMLFARAPKIEWNQGEAEIKVDWDNIDGAGNAGHVFVKRFSEMAVRDGLAAIVVDHAPQPQEPGVIVHSGNEAALGLQPRWSAYSRLSSLSWFVDAEGGQSTLTQVVFHEPGVARAGTYGVKSVDRYRVLRLVDGRALWTLYERKVETVARTTVTPEDFAAIRAGLFRNRAGVVADFLPVAVAYTGRSDAPFTASIPLLGVAYKNLGHWQASTNLTFGSSVASYAQPVVIGDLVNTDASGVSRPTLKLGPLVVVHLQVQPNGPAPDFKWAAPPVEAFAQLEKNIEVKERHMGQLGMSFLSPQKRQQETATAERLDSTAENASLSTAAQGIDDAVNLAFEFHAWYRGIPKAGAPVFQINRDFESQAMDAQTMAVYVQAVKDAGLPPRLLLEAWQAGGRLPPDADLDVLEMQMLGYTAVDEQNRQDMAAQLVAV
jgi:hypothetical protein